MGLYISRPQHVEAIQWTGDNGREIIRAIGEDRVSVTQNYPNDGYDAYYYTLKLQAGVDGCQGWVDVPVGHWLVHPPDDLSDVWPVEDTYFRAKYREAVDGDDE